MDTTGCDSDWRPDNVLDGLRWHVDTQLETDAQRESELLFPSHEGGF